MTLPESAPPSLPLPRSTAAASTASRPTLDRDQRRLAEVVADATDNAGLGATATELLLELQFRLGSLAAVASEGTGRGRRPFRPDQSWHLALSRLAFDLYVLADQTGVDLDVAVRAIAAQANQMATAAAVDTTEWPFPG